MIFWHNPNPYIMGKFEMWNCVCIRLRLRHFIPLTKSCIGYPVIFCTCSLLRGWCILWWFWARPVPKGERPLDTQGTWETKMDWHGKAFQQERHIIVIHHARLWSLGCQHKINRDVRWTLDRHFALHCNSEICLLVVGVRQLLVLRVVCRCILLLLGPDPCMFGC